MTWPKGGEDQLTVFSPPARGFKVILGMRRFEVWRLVTKDKHNAFRHVMVLQSEKIDHLSTIIVAPLRDAGSDMLIPSLTPSIEINGTFLVPLMMSIDRKLLDVCVYNWEAHAYEISTAIELVFMEI